MTLPAVFLDRDGTLIEEVGYLDRVDRVALYPWSIDAVRVLNRAGLRVVMVSNQSGVARGFFSEAVVEEVHRHIADLLEADGSTRSITARTPLTRRWSSTAPSATAASRSPV